MFYCTISRTIVSLKKITLMVITSYSDFRQKLKDYLDKVIKNHSPLFITRAKGESLVVLSQSDYESIMETFYLVKSPKNAQRL